MPTPRLTTLTGVSNALINTVGVEQAVHILISQFGWDLAFSALSRLDSTQGSVALWRAVETLVQDDLPRVEQD